LFDGNNDIVEETDLIRKRNDTGDALHKLSSTAVDNAFNCVDFGDDIFGIYGCSPSDMIDAFLEGVLKLCVESFIDPLKPRTKAAVDDLVDYLSGNFRSSEKVKC
jgi:hypothetical protein